MYQSFWTKIQSVGILDRTAWSTGAHMSCRNYSIVRRVFTGKHWQDATVEFLVLLAHFLAQETRGRYASLVAADAGALGSIDRTSCSLQTFGL